MKFDSPLYDRIRVKPEEDRRLRETCPACEWPGCKAPGTHRAPKGREREREYWQFCLEHVRHYNHTYNYFSGMSPDDVARYQRETVIGHRPTWKLGMNGSARNGRSHSARFGGRRGPRFNRQFEGAGDPFDMFREFGGPAGAKPDFEPRSKTTRTVHNAERRALDVLGLESEASARDIKARFKTLVKRLHPDANGGDRSSEDRLREIIQAYNYLKSVRFG